MTAMGEITVKVNADVTAFRRDLRAVRSDLLKLRIAASPMIVALMCACALVLGVALGRLL